MSSSKARGGLCESTDSRKVCIQHLTLPGGCWGASRQGQSVYLVFHPSISLVTLDLEAMHDVVAQLIDDI